MRGRYRTCLGPVSGRRPSYRRSRSGAGAGLDKTKLDSSLENLETRTAEWAKSHPLNPRDKNGSSASGRGLIVFPALLLGLLGGWLGLVLVIAFYKAPLIEPSARQGVMPNPKLAGAGPMLGSKGSDHTSHEDPASRLRTLRNLKDEGLISDEEFEERRQEVLTEL